MSDTTAETATDLKPCPFYGHTQIRLGCFRLSYYVICNECSTPGPYAPTREEAIRLWNTRPTDAAAEARAEARGRTQALDDIATAIKALPVSRKELHPSCGYNHIPLEASEFRREVLALLIASRTGEGEADSADSGEEEKQSGENG